MARNSTRAGRRRRVLNEEVLSASNIAIHRGGENTGIEPGDTPRYGAGANIENHPQVTSFVPRRFRSLSLFAFVGLSVAVGAEFAAYYAQALSALIKVISASEITEVLANRPTAWMSAAVLLLTVGYTRLIFSLRRHRVDDYRGRYRIWRTAGWAAMALSINTVVGGHSLVARYLGSLAQWQMLPASAGWWLVPTVLFGGLLMIKLMIDASECKSALALYLLATVCLGVAGASSAGWSPEWMASFPELISRALPLAGFTFLLVGSQTFARYVILDVQGLIEHTAPVMSETAAANQTIAADEPDAGNEEANVQAVEEQPAASSDWVDGSEPENEYDQQSTRKLSKAERKRLRKQKQRNRAA